MRHGAVELVVAAIAAGWERLAMQMPSSPYHVGVLAEPIGDLKRGAFALAIVLFVAAWLSPWTGPSRWVAWLIHGGVVITVVGLVYGAATGMKGVQFEDPRPDSSALLATRLAGEVILAVGLVAWVLRLLRTRPPDSSP